METSGKTPEATLNALIGTDIKVNAEKSRFMRTARGFFGLREWEFEEYVPKTKKEKEEEGRIYWLISTSEKNFKHDRKVLGLKFQGLKERNKRTVMKLPLQTKSLHDRIGEMLAIVGSWMGYNTSTRQRITPESAYELDVTWLLGKNPAVAIEVQIGGNIDSAVKKLTEAKNFNYRKVILVIEENQLSRLNAILKFDSIRHWLDAWSIKSVYDLYTSGEQFFNLYERIDESRYKDIKNLKLI